MKIAGHTMGTPELNLFEAIDLFEKLELDGIEIAVQDGYKCGLSHLLERQELLKVKSALQSSNLKVACLTPYFSLYNSLHEEIRKQEIEGLKLVINQAEELNASYIRIYGGKFEADETDVGQEKRKRLINSMQILGEYASKASVVLVIENHFNTMTVTAQDTVDIVSEINHPAVKILYDQANLAFLGLNDYKKAISLQNGLIELVHVKDLVYREAVGSARPFKASSVSHVSEEERTVNSKIIGQGILPWPEILETLIKYGYNGWLSMEYERRWHPQDLPIAEEGMLEGARYLRQCLRDLKTKIR